MLFRYSKTNEIIVLTADLILSSLLDNIYAWINRSHKLLLCIFADDLIAMDEINSTTTQYGVFFATRGEWTYQWMKRVPMW